MGKPFDPPLDPPRGLIMVNGAVVWFLEDRCHTEKQFILLKKSFLQYCMRQN